MIVINYFVIYGFNSRCSKRLLVNFNACTNSFFKDTIIEHQPKKLCHLTNTHNNSNYAKKEG